jgi:flavin-dependent dehydrogenase
VDPGALKRSGGAAAAVAEILEASGVVPREPLDSVEWLGTVPLTRRMARPAGHRVIVLGDAAGYIEPFTGEGMAWALAAAEAAVPFVLEGQSTWSEALERRWVSAFRRAVGREQRWCRVVSRALRHPGVVRVALAALRLQPRLARPVISHLTPAARGS